MHDVWFKHLATVIDSLKPHQLTFKKLQDYWGLDLNLVWAGYDANGVRKRATKALAKDQAKQPEPVPAPFSPVKPFISHVKAYPKTSAQLSPRFSSYLENKNQLPEHL
jgi:hypothetical protein